MTPHDNAIARIVAGMELVARGLTMRLDRYDAPITPVADEVQLLADAVADLTAEIDDLSDQLAGINETCREALADDPDHTDWAPANVRRVVDLLGSERETPATDTGA